MAGFDERERRLIRQAACELRDALGVDKLVSELGADRDDALWMTLMSVLKGAGQPTKQLVEGVARLKGVSIEQLLSPPTATSAATSPAVAADPYPNRAKALALFEEEGISREVHQEILLHRPEKDLSPREWYQRIVEAEQRQRASTPPTLPVDPAIAPVTIVKPPPTIEAPTREARSDVAAKRTSRVSDVPDLDLDPSRSHAPVRRAVDVPVRTTLQMIDGAAISMGLDLFPRRREEIYGEYGMSVDDGEREMAAWRDHLEKNPRDRATWQSMREGSRNSWLRAEREKGGQSAAATKPSLDLPPAPLAMPPASPVAPVLEPPFAPSSTLATGRALEAPPTVPDVPEIVASKKIDPTVHFTGQDVFAVLSAEPVPTVPTPAPVTEAPPANEPVLQQRKKLDDRTMVLTKVSDRAPDATESSEGKPAAPPRKKFDEPTMKHVANAPRQKNKYDDETMRALQPIAPITPGTTNAKRRTSIDPTIAMPPEPHDAQKKK